MEKRVWPTVALSAIVATAVTVLLLNKVSVVEILAAFGVVGSVITMMLYSKVSQVESNTNGNSHQQLQLIKELTEHAKSSVPLDSIKRVETTLVDSQD